MRQHVPNSSLAEKDTQTVCFGEVAMQARSRAANENGNSAGITRLDNNTGLGNSTL